ncbi:MAG TPA: Rid family detoxifying hydrolase [Armatimonadota bacterium]|jgi:2-iminobutanoate/2-iminopropanoate deaminase
MSKVTYEGAIKAAGAPYSPAVEANGFVFVSGQVPLDPETRAIVPGGIEEQAKQVLSNLVNVLAAAGCKPEDVVRTTVYLADISTWGTVNGIYAQVFPSAPPARTAFAVAALPFGAEIEIDAIAAKPVG